MGVLKSPALDPLFPLPSLIGVTIPRFSVTTVSWLPLSLELHWAAQKKSSGEYFINNLSLPVAVYLKGPKSSRQHSINN